MEYVSALIFPFILLFLEKLLPYPYILEEIFKFFLAKKAKDTKSVFLLGLLFSLSEAILYLINPSYYLNTSFTKSILRFVIVTPVHITTLFVMYYFNKKPKYYYLIGLIIAVLIHYAFNNLNL